MTLTLVIPSAIRPPISAGRRTRPLVLDDLSLGDVLTNMDQVLTVGNRAKDLDLILLRKLGVFQHDHRICSAGQHSSGVNQCALTRTDLECRRITHRNFPDQGQISGQRVARAMCIPRPDGVTVHGGAVKVRQRMRRPDLLGQDTAQGRGRLYFLRLNCGPGKMCEKESTGLIRRKEGKKFGHGVSEARMSG